MSDTLKLKLSFVRIVLCIIGISFRTFSFAQNTPTLHYHFDESGQIKKTKQKIKELKQTLLRESINDEKKKKLNAEIAASKTILDSLENLEDHKINASLRQLSKPSHFDFDHSFTNKNYSNGRPSSIYGMCYNPSLKYKHKSGLYTQLSLYEYPEDNDFTVGIPEWDIAVGYGKYVTENLYLSSSYSFSKLNYGSKASQLLLANSLSLSSSYDFNMFYVGADLMYLFGGPASLPAQQKQEALLSFYIDKDITLNHFLGSYYFNIDPELTIDFGSDNLFQARKKLAGEQVVINKKGKVVPVTVPDNFWGLLGVNMAVNFSYKIRNFNFYLTPHFVIPYNVLNAKNVREPGASSPIFYFNTGITYRFKL